ncbi:MAG: N-formylglutamate amidohydrolase [Betaproteobacteria bacterium]|nr:N-formylglutamate amidohydrolase [Betaproteobacteria bacterium]MBK6602540.1 N-formylglutamate amidohydrolase [Betaproteobacteria bacterium]
MSPMCTPFALHRPAAGALPLVLDSPHSGEFYPDDFDHAPPREIVRQAEDTHVARLYGCAPALGATLLEANFPRAYVDANRSLADIDPELLADDWGEPLAPGRKTAQGIGLVWRLARNGAPMYRRRLAAAEIRERIERWYRPYHAALDAELNLRHREFGSVWHLDCHSMPAVGDERADDPGRERADFVLGDRDGTTCAPAFTAFVAATLADLGYRVAINDPYKGVEIVRRHGRPAERRHSLQVEVKRTLYMDEASLLPNAGYARLEADLARLLAALQRHIRGELAGASGLRG